MFPPARRVAVLSTVIGLGLLAVIVALAVISSPGPPLLEREEPVRISVEDRDTDDLGETDPSQQPQAEPPTDPDLERGPLAGLQFRPDPPARTDPAPRTGPQQQTQPVAPPPAQRPAPPASDYDDDPADDGDDGDDGDDDGSDGGDDGGDDGE